MTAVALSPEPGSAWSGADRAPLLRRLIFIGGTVFPAILLWRYGLLRLMVVSDRTYLLSLITLIYVGSHSSIRSSGRPGRRIANA
jgi:hypothetical protein